MSAGRGLDLGRSAVRSIELRASKGSIAVTRYLSTEVEPGETAVEAAADTAGRQKGGAARVGLTGADLMMRYLPVPEVEDWRLERLMSFEVGELESKSGAPLASSYNLLPVPKELDDEDTMLLSLVRESLLEDCIEGLGGIQVSAFTPNAIALYNAYLALGDHAQGVTLLANIGATTLDLALVRGSELYFARSVTSGLDKRDKALADRIGADPVRAERLIRKHLDLGAAAKGALSGEAETVTRPLLPLYDALPNLLNGVVTLCKAQARLRELKLDRVLLTGGGAAARGLDQFLNDRMRVSAQVWNPVPMLDLSKLPDDQADSLEADGAAAAVSIGLALSAADPELFALEILPKAARKKRQFQERGIFAVLAGLLVLLFLGADYVITSGRADKAGSFARQVQGRVGAREGSHQRTTDLLVELERQDALMQDLVARQGVRRTAEETLLHLSEQLPENLWVETLRVELGDGSDWGQPERALPVLSLTGRGKDAANPASREFANFGDSLKDRLPGAQDAIRNTTRGGGRNFEWGIDAHLVSLPSADPEDEE